MSNPTTTEPSVEDCLKELREMFPATDEPRTVLGWRSVISYRLSPVTEQPEYGVSLYYKAQTETPTYYAPTLSEAMAQVRAWHAEQSKSQQ